VWVIDKEILYYMKKCPSLDSNLRKDLWTILVGKTHTEMSWALKCCDKLIMDMWETLLKTLNASLSQLGNYCIKMITSNFHMC
jgi:hypothetical protein